MLRRRKKKTPPVHPPRIKRLIDLDPIETVAFLAVVNCGFACDSCKGSTGEEMVGWLDDGLDAKAARGLDAEQQTKVIAAIRVYLDEPIGPELRGAIDMESFAHLAKPQKKAPAHLRALSRLPGGRALVKRASKGKFDGTEGSKKSLRKEKMRVVQLLITCKTLGRRWRRRTAKAKAEREALEEDGFKEFVVAIAPREKLGFGLRKKSVICYDIEAGGQGERVGVVENDVIIAINGEVVDGEADYKAARKTLVAAIGKAKKRAKKDPEGTHVVELTLRRGVKRVVKPKAPPKRLGSTAVKAPVRAPRAVQQANVSGGGGGRSRPRAPDRGSRTSLGFIDEATEDGAAEVGEGYGEADDGEERSPDQLERVRFAVMTPAERKTYVVASQRHGGGVALEAFLQQRGLTTTPRERAAFAASVESDGANAALDAFLRQREDPTSAAEGLVGSTPVTRLRDQTQALGSLEAVAAERAAAWERNTWPPAGQIDAHRPRHNGAPRVPRPRLMLAGGEILVQYAAPERLGVSLCDFVAEDGTLCARVGEVLPGSVADEAGVWPMDAIAAISGVNVLGHTIEIIGAALRAATETAASEDAKWPERAHALITLAFTRPLISAPASERKRFDRQAEMERELREQNVRRAAQRALRSQDAAAERTAAEWQRMAWTREEDTLLQARVLAVRRSPPLRPTGLTSRGWGERDVDAVDATWSEPMTSDAARTFLGQGGGRAMRAGGAFGAERMHLVESIQRESRERRLREETLIEETRRATQRASEAVEDAWQAQAEARRADADAKRVVEAFSHSLRQQNAAAQQRTVAVVTSPSGGRPVAENQKAAVRARLAQISSTVASIASAVTQRDEQLATEQQRSAQALTYVAPPNTRIHIDRHGQIEITEPAASPPRRQQREERHGAGATLLPQRRMQQQQQQQPNPHAFSSEQRALDELRAQVAFLIDSEERSQQVRRDAATRDPRIVRSFICDDAITETQASINDARANLARWGVGDATAAAATAEMRALPPRYFGVGAEKVATAPYFGTDERVPQYVLSPPPAQLQSWQSPPRSTVVDVPSPSTPLVEALWSVSGASADLSLSPSLREFALSPPMPMMQRAPGDASEQRWAQSVESWQSQGLGFGNLKLPFEGSV